MPPVGGTCCCCCIVFALFLPSLWPPPPPKPVTFDSWLRLVLRSSGSTRATAAEARPMRRAPETGRSGGRVFGGPRACARSLARSLGARGRPTDEARRLDVCAGREMQIYANRLARARLGPIDLAPTGRAEARQCNPASRRATGCPWPTWEPMQMSARRPTGRCLIVSSLAETQLAAR